MAIKGIARRAHVLHGKIENRVIVHSQAVVVGSSSDVPGLGTLNIAIQIDGESFKELALAMMTANSEEAIDAFSVALHSFA